MLGDEFDEIDEFDEFVQFVRDILENQTFTTDKKASELLGLSNMSELRLETIISIILQYIIKLTSKNEMYWLFTMVKCICAKDKTQHFQPLLRDRSLELLKKLAIIPDVPAHIPLQLNAIDGINSLDKQVNCIEQIEYYCSVLRRKCVVHFVGHMFASNLINLTDILDIQRLHPILATEILGVTDNSQNCCVLTLPATVQNILRDQQYLHIVNVENDIFWHRNGVTFFYTEARKLGNLNEFDFVPFFSHFFFQVNRVKIEMDLQPQQNNGKRVRTQGDKQARKLLNGKFGRARKLQNSQNGH